MPTLDTITTPLERTVQANGLRIYFEEYGHGDPLILLHGALGTGITQWEAQIPLLAEHFRVIMPDARGHGRTEMPPGEIRLRELSDDVAAFIHALNLEKPFLCGWSTGADTAVDFCIRYPQSVKAIVAGGVTHRLSETYFEGLAALGVEGPGRVNTAQTEKAMPDLVAMIRSAHAQGPEHWKMLFRQLSYEMMEPTLPSPDDLRKISSPTLIIWGDRDQFLPIENAIELYRLIANAELAVVPGANHFVCLTHPELFARLVTNFLLRQTAPARLEHASA